MQGSIRPTPDSDIGFEVWLPPEGAWNGKYEGIGNGGFAGSLILPLYSIATTLFYYDIRIRREGFDLEVMAGKIGGPR